MTAPSVYAAINAITAELATNGIAKRHVNDVDDYKYRSFDDVLNRLAPLLSKHRLCVLPRAVELVVSERSDDQKRLLLQVTLLVSFTLTSAEDGSSHTVEAYGEALDGGDKATAKAMSAAYKTAMIQTFCIPVGGAEDPDHSTHKLAAQTHDPEPPQGWTQWCLDIEDIVSLCESEQAISTVHESHRGLLKALAREQPALYAQLGEAFVSRRETLRAASRTANKRSRGKRAAKANGTPPVDVEHV